MLGFISYTSNYHYNLLFRNSPWLSCGSLPVDTAFNWDYQTDVYGLADFPKDADIYGADGMLREGKNLEYIVSYSRDQDRRIGASSV